MEVTQFTETFPTAQKADTGAGSLGVGYSLPQRHAAIGPTRPVPGAPEKELLSRVLKGLHEPPGRPPQARTPALRGGRKMDLATRCASADLQRIGHRALALASVLPRSTSADVREFAG